MVGLDAKARQQRRSAAGYARPPRRLFDPGEVAAAGGNPEKRRFPGLNTFMDYFEGSYFHSGYLLKLVDLKSVQTEKVEPSLEELRAFQAPARRHDDEGAPAPQDAAAGDLLDMAAAALGEVRAGALP